MLQEPETSTGLTDHLAHTDLTFTVHVCYLKCKVDMAQAIDFSRSSHNQTFKGYQILADTQNICNILSLTLYLSNL